MTNFKPDNFPTLSPYLTVQDAGKSLDFYQKAFGFGEANTIEEDGKIVHAALRFKDSVIMFGPEGAYDSPYKAPASLGVLSSSNLYIYCDDVDALYKRAVDAGAKSIMEPQDSFWGDRICRVSDPDGHEFMFAKLL